MCKRRKVKSIWVFQCSLACTGLWDSLRHVHTATSTTPFEVWSRKPFQLRSLHHHTVSCFQTFHILFHFCHCGVKNFLQSALHWAAEKPASKSSKFKVYANDEIYVSHNYSQMFCFWILFSHYIESRKEKKMVLP